MNLALRPISTRVLRLALLLGVMLSACAGPEPIAPHEATSSEEIPHLAPVDLGDDERLKVVASTTIIGDLVSQIGGDDIELMVLLLPGQDPHSYEPAPVALTVIEEADVVFVNGFDLEENLLTIIEPLSGLVPVVPISSTVRPRSAEDTDHPSEHVVDPHVWLDPANMQVWAQNAADVLSMLDPAHEHTFRANADHYRAALQELDDYIQTQVDTIPPDRRKLVTNHDALGYFAARYGFEIVATVYTGTGALAEPSAGDLARLVRLARQEDTPAIFVETSVSAQVARILAEELGDGVGVYTLYTGSLGEAGSGAEDYLSMMRLNVDTIVEALGK